MTITVLQTTWHNNDQHMHYQSKVLVVIYMLGNLFEVVLVFLVSILFLQRKGHAIASRNSPPSYDNYGLFWGCVATSLVGNGFLTQHTIVIIHSLTTVTSVFFLLLALLALSMTAALTVAIYYGVKLDLYIPSIFLLPFKILFCNHAQLVSRKIVQVLSLCSLIVFLLHILCRASFIFLSLLARPAVVISTSLLYIFAAFCTVHFMAILFTTSKLRRKAWKKHKRIPTIVIDLVQTLTLLFIFATAFCFGLVIGAAGALANYGTNRTSLYPTLSNLVTSLVLAAFGWILRKIGSQWLQYNAIASADEEANCNTNELPLLQSAGSNSM